MPGDDGGLLAPREVAAIFRVRTATVWMWTRAGKIHAVRRTPGGHRRYSREEVEIFLGRPLPPSQPEGWVQDAVRLYDQGWTIRQVAARFEVSYDTMRRLLHKHTTIRQRTHNIPPQNGTTPT